MNSRYWTLAKRPPPPWPDEATFALKEAPVPTPGPGQALTSEGFHDMRDEPLLVPPADVNRLTDVAEATGKPAKAAAEAEAQREWQRQQAQAKAEQEAENARIEAKTERIKAETERQEAEHAKYLRTCQYRLKSPQKCRVKIPHSVA